MEHIPFRNAEKRGALHQNWKKLTFLHWEVNPAELRKHLPAGLELDLFEGKAYDRLYSVYYGKSTTAYDSLGSRNFDIW